MNVVTRARAKSLAEQEKLERATEEAFGGEISSWDNIPLDDDFPEVAAEQGVTITVLPANVDKKFFLAQQQADDSLTNLWTQAQDNAGKPYATSGGLLVKMHTDQLGQQTDLLVVPRPRRHQVFEEAHTVLLAGHFGAGKTKEKIKRLYFWPGMDAEIKS